MEPQNRIAAILGAVDGMTLAVSLIFGRTPAVFHAALDAGVGELASMAAAMYLSDPLKRFFPALLCGIATLSACVLPAVPYIFSQGLTALIASSAIAVAVASVICVLRPEKGLLAILETFGVLALAAGLCFAISLL